MLVARNVYDSNNMGRLKLFGAVLSAMQIDAAGRIAIVYLDHEMARAAGGTYEDTEGLINLPLTVKEIQAVVFFKQIEGDEYRVSMRSKGDIDIGAVAKEFGGGGHKNAAGCTVTGAIDALQKLFVEKIGRDQLADRRCRVKSRVLTNPDPRILNPRTPWTACSSSTSRSARPRTTSSRACGARSASAASATPARSIRRPAACCRWSLGRATRLARFLSAGDKSYDAVDRLGCRDRHRRRARARASVPVHAGALPSRAAIDAALERFRGRFLQQPPAYLGEEDRTDGAATRRRGPPGRAR